MKTRFANNGRRWFVAVGILLFACLLSALLLHRRHKPWSVTPDRDAVFVSTRYITSIAIATDGTVWAGSQGGVLRRRPDGTWNRYTRLDGLPSREVRAVRIECGAVTADTPLGTAVWRNDRWCAIRSAPASPAARQAVQEQTCSTVWRGVRYVATPHGLDGQVCPLPPSTGTHISALLPHRDSLWAALFGDGLWAYDGQRWQPVDVGLPAQAREITALAGDDQAFWVGTRRAGLWERCGGQWKQYFQPDEPIAHDCQAITQFRGSLYVSTLEDGMAVRTPQGWGHLQIPAFSSNAPRQMVVYKGWLYLRHGNGKLDRYDGVRWERDIGARLPRRQVSAIAADRDRLYVAQWGGWSEFDGKTWTHFLTLPELQGIPVTFLYPEQARLWIGTQGHGLAEYSHVTGAVRWHDERNGLPDDWVTTISRSGNKLYVGTFVGGLADWDGKCWHTTPELAGENVTALESSANGEVLVATRHGVQQISARGQVQKFRSERIDPDPEAQCLYRGSEGIWIGTRTGLFFVKQR